MRHRGRKENENKAFHWEGWGGPRREGRGGGRSRKKRRIESEHVSKKGGRRLFCYEVKVMNHGRKGSSRIELRGELDIEPRSGHEVGISNSYFEIVEKERTQTRPRLRGEGHHRGL